MGDAGTTKTPATRQPRYVYLVFAIVGFTLLQMSTPHLFLIDLAFVAVLLATIRAMKGHRTAVLLAVAMIVAFWATSAARVALGSNLPLLIVDELLVSSFMVLVAAVILRDVLSATAITTDKIYGAICSYILIAMGWAAVYGAVGLLIPDAFRFPDPAPDLSQPGSGTMVYFSFVTLTTLGYGDIVPVHRLARTLCWMEAAFGQIYLAVLIAKLVSVHQSSRKSS